MYIKHVTNYINFPLSESTTGSLNHQQIDFLNRCASSRNHTVWQVNPATGLVDVTGSLISEGRNEDRVDYKLQSFFGLKFGTVTGDFLFRNNLFKSLAGAPREVGGSFSFLLNPLTSLVGAPLRVGGDFIVNDLSFLNGTWNPINISDSLARGEIRNLEYPGWYAPAGEFSRKITPNGIKLLRTLPFLKPQFWLDLHRTNRKEFNSLWLEYRKDPRFSQNRLCQEVEAGLNQRARTNLSDLEMLDDFM